MRQTKSSLLPLELAFSPMGAFLFRVEFHRLSGVQGPFHADVGMHSTALLCTGHKPSGRFPTAGSIWLSA